jgi:MFS family permease
LGNSKNQLKEKFSFFDMPMLGVFSSFIYGLFESSVVVALPLYSLRIGFTENEVSYLLASFVTGGIILLYFISRFADFYSKYNVLLIISFLLFILFLFPIFSHNFLFLIIMLFILGGIIPAFYTVGLSYTAEKVENKYITFANSYYIMLYGLGTIIGPIFGSLLVDWNLKIGFWLISSILCLMFFIVFSSNKLVSKVKA